MKTALITGASRGIGAACARILAKDGYYTVINYVRSEAKAEALARELGGTAIRADVSDRRAVNEMFERAGGVDVLVCNAAIAHYGLFTDVSEPDWRRLLDVNIGGVINCAQAAIPYMTRKKSGCIVSVSSIWGITGASCEAVYSATKAAVIGLTKSLAKELGPSGVRVNCVAPGAVDTDMLSSLSADEREELRLRAPLGRLGAPEDIAALVGFLASDAAGFITGQVISSNGGFLI